MTGRPARHARTPDGRHHFGTNKLVEMTVSCYADVRVILRAYKHARLSFCLGALKPQPVADLQAALFLPLRTSDERAFRKYKA